VFLTFFLFLFTLLSLSPQSLFMIILFTPTPTPSLISSFHKLFLLSFYPFLLNFVGEGEKKQILLWIFRVYIGKWIDEENMMKRRWCEGMGVAYEVKKNAKF
jgi:hypothetical protein